MRTRAIRAALIVLVMTSAPALAETRLAQAWSDRAYINNHGPFRSLLVIGVTEKSATRAALEKAFADALHEFGVKATPSLVLMTADAEITKQTVLSAIAGTDIDGVLLTHLYRVDEIDIVQIDDPGSKRSERDFALGLWRDYQHARDFALDADVKKKLRFVLENNVYDVNSAELVWTVQSYSTNPKSAADIIGPLSGLVAEQLIKENLI